MANVIQKGQPYNFSDDQIIMFTDAKKVKNFQGYFDIPSMSSFYKQDPDKMHMGMQKFFINQKMISKGMFPELMQEKKVLEVDGFDGEFTYSVPVKKKGGCFTNRDYSWQVKPGIDEGKFLIALNRQFSAGDILTNDPSRGQQIVVMEEDVDVDGDTFIHTVTLAENDARRYFDPKNLISGIEFVRINQTIFGEYGTNFGAIDVTDGPGEMKMRYQLGNLRGIESAYTAKADKRGFGGASASTMEFMDTLLSEADQMGEIAVIANVDKKSNKPTSVASIGSTVEFLVLRELEKLTATSLMFQKAATIKTSNGLAKLNEGLWHQLRRGKLIKYSRPGGITVSQIKEAVEYVFRGNYMLPSEEREITFDCGKAAYDNVLEIFAEEVRQQISNLGFLQQSSGGSLLPNQLITGSNNHELVLDFVRFTGVYLPGIGKVKLKHNINLDHGFGMRDRFSEGFHQNGFAETTYSMIIWDATSQASSNNLKRVEGAEIVDGGNAGSNLYLVKPKGEMTYWGRENGRYDSYKAGDIVSSHKQLASSFWAYNSCSVVALDVSRFVMIELSERKGFN